MGPASGTLGRRANHSPVHAKRLSLPSLPGTVQSWVPQPLLLLPGFPGLPSNVQSCYVKEVIVEQGEINQPEDDSDRMGRLRSRQNCLLSSLLSLFRRMHDGIVQEGWPIQEADAEDL